MQAINIENITIDNLSIQLLTKKKVSIDVLRLDKIHPLVSGNKWFKLSYYIEEATQQNKKNILTFGGAWSNHILATAAVCNINQLNSIGIIRGEEPENISSTLFEAKELGMKLFFINRNDYQQKKVPSALDKTDYYKIAEGGFGNKGAVGASTILDHCIIADYTHICCAAGTGTMAAGLLGRISEIQQIIAISVLKNYLEIEKSIKEIADKPTKNLTVNHDYHFGGYAKHKPALLEFMNEFFNQTSIPTDFVYTGKLCYAILDMIKKNYFAKGSNLLLIHSGGLQGNASLSKRTLIF
ncbi:MAG: 1-aminocyclopropane-1-carboxylate deaminase [Chitinophagaceae bacterium]